jgi:L-ascorbate metabolism protein UlaG (beta-lactamase superfamily)
MFFSFYYYFLVIFLVINISTSMSSSKDYPSYEKIRNSPNYNDGKFYNIEETNQSFDGNFFSILWKMFTAKETKPSKPIETKIFDKNEFMNNPDELVVTWFGHSSILLKLHGKVILTDPMFSTHASPVQFAGPKKFEYTNDYKPEDMPDIDILFITHDHYDHLDKNTIRKLDGRIKEYFVPLGVDKILINWGIDSDKIEIADWWDSFDNLGFQITYVPMRHFSGRGITGRNGTLWGGWAIKSEEYNILLGGDSSYGSHFKSIGDKLGPFDITFLECGQYNEAWRHAHQMPEESVQAHLDLKGDMLIPIHWGKFSLSIHPWYEPLERVRDAAKEKNVNLFAPVIGEINSYSNTKRN